MSITLPKLSLWTLGEFGRCPMRAHLAAIGAPERQTETAGLSAADVRRGIRSSLVSIAPEDRRRSAPESWPAKDRAQFDAAVEAIDVFEQRQVRRELVESLTIRSGPLAATTGPILAESCPDGTWRVVVYAVAGPDAIGDTDDDIFGSEADGDSETPDPSPVRRVIVDASGPLSDRMYRASLYGCALGGVFGAHENMRKVSEVAVRFLRPVGARTAKPTLVEHVARLDQHLIRRCIEIFEHQIDRYVAAQESQSFRCRVTGGCASCAYVDSCPEHTGANSDRPLLVP